MTGDLMTASHILHFRHHTANIPVLHKDIWYGNGSPVGGLIGLGISPSILLFTLLSCQLRIGHRNASKQAFGIGMQRMTIDLVCLRRVPPAVPDT